MSQLGNYRKLYAHFRFHVLIEDIPSAAFRKVDGLEFEFDEMLYAEGGAYVDYKEPGKMKFSDITLERGVSQDVAFYNWAVTVVNVMAKLPGGIGGSPAAAFIKDVHINQLDRDDVVAYEHKVYWAWPKKFTAGSWDNMSSEVTIETLVLACHHWERV